MLSRGTIGDWTERRLAEFVQALPAIQRRTDTNPAPPSSVAGAIPTPSSPPATTDDGVWYDGFRWIAGKVTNSRVADTAAIAYSKLNLAASIVNADIANAAAIAYSKLNLALSIVNGDIATNADIAYTKLGAIPFCDVTHNANQSISDATPTILAFNTETSDTTAMHDTAVNNSRITVATAGVYALHANVQWAANAVGHRTLELYLNGTTVIESLTDDATGGGHDTNQQIVSHRRLAANDYIEVRVTQDSGGALNVLTGTNVPHFEATWLGA